MEQENSLEKKVEDFFVNNKRLISALKNRKLHLVDTSTTYSYRTVSEAEWDCSDIDQQYAKASYYDVVIHEETTIETYESKPLETLTQRLNSNYNKEEEEEIIKQINKGKIFKRWILYSGKVVKSDDNYIIRNISEYTKRVD